MQLEHFVSIDRAWNAQQAKAKGQSLMLAVFNAFWRELVLLGALDAINVFILRLGPALLLGQFLQFFR